MYGSFLRKIASNQCNLSRFSCFCELILILPLHILPWSLPRNRFKGAFKVADAVETRLVGDLLHGESWFLLDEFERVCNAQSLDVVGEGEVGLYLVQHLGDGLMRTAHHFGYQCA